MVRSYTLYTLWWGFFGVRRGGEWVVGGWNGNSYSVGDNNYGYWEWLSLTYHVNARAGQWYHSTFPLNKFTCTHFFDGLGKSTKRCDKKKKNLFTKKKRIFLFCRPLVFSVRSISLLVTIKISLHSVFADTNGMQFLFLHTHTHGGTSWIWIQTQSWRYESVTFWIRVIYFARWSALANGGQFCWNSFRFFFFFYFLFEKGMGYEFYRTNWIIILIYI